MSNRQTLTEDEIRTITSRIRDGTATDAEEVTLFEGMAPFIRRIGEKFRPSLRCPDEVDDLQQEAFPALLEAARTWKPDRGYSFASWLSYYLHSAFSDYIGRQNGGSRRTNEQQRQLVRLENEYRAKRGRPAPDLYLMKALGISEKTLRAWRGARSLGSLDAPLDEDGDLTALDKVADPVPMEETVIERIINDQVRELLQRYLDELDPLERDALTMIFYHRMTQAAAAEFYGISSQAFRRRLMKALEKLRSRRHLIEIGQLLPERVGSVAFSRPRRSGRWQSSTEMAAFIEILGPEAYLQTGENDDHKREIDCARGGGGR